MSNDINNNKDSEITKEADAASGMFTKALKILAIPLAAAAGMVYGRSSVSDKSYEKLRNLGAFDHLRGIRHDKARTFFKDWENGEKDISTKINEMNFAHAKEVDARIAEIGYDSAYKRFMGLHPTQRREVVMGAFTASGIALGVILTIADHKHLFSLLRSKDDNEVSK